MRRIVVLFILVIGALSFHIIEPAPIALANVVDLTILPQLVEYPIALNANKTSFLNLIAVPVQIPSFTTLLPLIRDPSKVLNATVRAFSVMIGTDTSFTMPGIQLGLYGNHPLGPLGLRRAFWQNDSYVWSAAPKAWGSQVFSVPPASPPRGVNLLPLDTPVPTIPGEQLWVALLVPTTYKFPITFTETAPRLELFGIVNATGVPLNATIGSLPQDFKIINATTGIWDFGISLLVELYLDINVSGPEQLGIYPSELSPWPVFINPIGPDGRPQYQIVTPNQVVDAASLPHFLSGLLIILFVILIL